MAHAKNWLNNRIDKLNTVNNVSKYPAIYGNITMTSFKVHMWQNWREQEKGNMLNIREDNRFKMATTLNNNFSWNTGTPNLPMALFSFASASNATAFCLALLFKYNCFDQQYFALLLDT